MFGNVAPTCFTLEWKLMSEETVEAGKLAVSWSRVEWYSVKVGGGLSGVLDSHATITPLSPKTFSYLLVNI